MKKKIIISVLFLASASLMLSAQNKIDPKVVVKRDYEGKLLEINKSLLNIGIDDSLYNFNLNMSYPTFSRPYKNLYEFSPNGTAEAPLFGTDRRPWMLARLAVAYPWIPEADIYINPRFGNRFSMLVYFNHSSFWGNLPVVSLKDEEALISDKKDFGDRMINRGGLGLGYDWKKGKLGMNVEYTNNYYAFYPADISRLLSDDRTVQLNHKGFRNLASHDFNKVSADIFLKSTDPEPYSFYYDFSAAYNFINNNQRYPVYFQVPANEVPLKEHSVDASLSLGAVIAGDHRVVVTLRDRTDWFRSVYDGNAVVTTGLWEVEPQYRWEKKRWGINLGAIISSTYSDSKAYDLPFSSFIYPDIFINFEAARNAFWIYLKFFGENRLYSQYELSNYNPWFDNIVRNYSSSSPIIGEFGFKGAVADKFLYHVYGRYEVANNKLSFASYDVFNLPYMQDNQIVTAGVAMKWNSKDVYADVDFKYHYYKDGESALLCPSFEVKAAAEYNYRKRLFIRADCNYRSSVNALDIHDRNMSSSTFYKIPGFVDLGLRISYSINTDVSVYLEGNNLLNQRIQYFLNYVEPGINIGIGLLMKF